MKCHREEDHAHGVRNVLRAITGMAWCGLHFFGLRGSAGGWPAGGFRLSDFDGLAEKRELLRLADKARGLFVWCRRRWLGKCICRRVQLLLVLQRGGRFHAEVQKCVVAANRRG
jgi:hypothetical protein